MRGVAWAGWPLAATDAGLGDGEAAGGGQEDDGEQAFGFHGAGGVADDLVV